MPNTVQGLIKRIPNGAPLTPQQGDGNLTILENFANALAAAVAASLNPDGTLINGGINNILQFNNPQYFADNLAAVLSLPTSTGLLLNQYIVDDANTTTVAYAAGMRVQFIANLTNTLGCTINYNGLGSKAIFKGINQPLAPNDIQVGAIVTLIYDGANFQMVGMLSAAASATNIGPVFLANDADIATVTNPANAVSVGNLNKNRFVSTQFSLPAGTGNIANVAHGLSNTAQIRQDWYLICTDAGGDGTFTLNDTISVAGISNLLPENAVTFSWGISTTGANIPTNVWLSIFNPNNVIEASRKDTGVSVTLTPSKWKAFCIAGIV